MLRASAAGVAASVNAAALLGMGSGVVMGQGPGVLEIKCPFNKGLPGSATPPKLAQWYYMPQVCLQAQSGQHSTQVSFVRSVCYSFLPPRSLAIYDSSSPWEAADSSFAVLHP